MYSFKNDYSEGAHPSILKALVNNNMTQQEGYGYDKFTLDAVDKIKREVGNDDVDVHLISGGTQTNLIAISSFLKPYQACICVDTGHIVHHETGAIEYTGHKVLTAKSEDGKINIDMIVDILSLHQNEHSVMPKLVYISNPTELGTMYDASELKELYTFCRKNDLLLYADGARLGSAICAENSNLSMKDMCDFTDAFFIGGTKNGALLGEALVIKEESLKDGIRYNLKQKGALLAKGRLLGIQFSELFEDSLFYDLARHANKMAEILRNVFKKNLVEFYVETKTNQIFPIFTDEQVKRLEADFAFYVWTKLDDGRNVARIVTSWATKPEEVTAFLDILTND